MAQGSQDCVADVCTEDSYDEPDGIPVDFPREDKAPTRKEPRGTGGDPREDLVEKGFIPYNELRLEDLPPDIRTQENLEHILRIGERVVRINNSKLSEKRNENEEMEMPGSSLQASGFVLHGSSAAGVRQVWVCTGEHVLYNEEEVRASTIDFFFDSYGGRRQFREWKRTQRGNGTVLYKHNSSVASYKLDPRLEAILGNIFLDGIKFMCCQPKRDRGCEWHAEPDEKDIVCVISHPLARSKHVSFGKIVEWHWEKKLFLYDAPTKPGCGGSPIIIFSRSSSMIPGENVFYHRGTDRRTGIGVGRVDDLRVFLPKCVYNDLEILSSPRRTRPTAVLRQCWEHLGELSLEDVRRQAQVETSISLLAAFLPIFAAFALQPEKYCSSERRLPHARPCQKLSQADTQLMKDDDAFFSRWASIWFRQCPSVFLPSTEPGEDHIPSLSALLTSEPPCWCQAIVDAVVQHTASENDASVDCFLRPDAVYGESPFPKTWPWSRDASRGGLRPGREPLLKHCLLKECLDVSRKSVQGRDVSLLLLSLIRRANYMLRQPQYETRRVKEENLDSCEKAQSTAADHKESALTEARAVNSVNPSLSERELVPRLFDVCILLRRSAFTMLCLGEWTSCFPAQVIKTVNQPENPDEDYVKNFHSTLDLIAHMKAHAVQDRPSRSPCQIDLSAEPACPCGRPSGLDVIEAFLSVALAAEVAIQFKQSTHREEHRSPKQTTLHGGYSVTRSQTPGEDFSTHTLLSKVMMECESANRDTPWPLEEFLARIDTLDNFKTSYDLISVSLISQEVFLFNCRHLLRQYRQLVSPCYISAPVSVLGRPGRWPAGAMPVAVKDTAWRLMQAACGKSPFDRRFLKVLEVEADRREKLIDWYVDMKQLKFAGDIEEEYMNTTCMRLCLEVNERERKCRWPRFQSTSPTVFVMRTFLALVKPLLPQMRGWHEDTLCRLTSLLSET